MPSIMERKSTNRAVKRINQNQKEVRKLIKISKSITTMVMSTMVKRPYINKLDRKIVNSIINLRRKVISIKRDLLERHIMSRSNWLLKIAGMKILAPSIKMILILKRIIVKREVNLLLKINIFQLMNLFITIRKSLINPIVKERVPLSHRIVGMKIPRRLNTGPRMIPGINLTMRGNSKNDLYLNIRLRATIKESQSLNLQILSTINTLNNNQSQR
jgi:hypothetical protein